MLHRNAALFPDTQQDVQAVAAMLFDMQENCNEHKSKYSSHFEVARFKKIAHTEWLQLIEENFILIMRRGVRKYKENIL